MIARGTYFFSSPEGRIYICLGKPSPLSRKGPPKRAFSILVDQS